MLRSLFYLNIERLKSFEIANTEIVLLHQHQRIIKRSMSAIRSLHMCSKDYSKQTSKEMEQDGCTVCLEQDKIEVQVALESLDAIYQQHFRSIVLLEPAN